MPVVKAKFYKGHMDGRTAYIDADQPTVAINGVSSNRQNTHAHTCEGFREVYAVNADGGPHICHLIERIPMHVIREY